MEVQSNSSNDTGKFMAKADKGSQEKQSSEKSNQLNFIFEDNSGKPATDSHNISQNNDQDTPVLGQIVPPPKSEGSSGSSDSPLKRLQKDFDKSLAANQNEEMDPAK